MPRSPQSIRNIRSAASENTALASAKDAPSPPRRSAHTAPLQTRRTHAPPAVGSTAGRTDVPPSAAIASGQSNTLPALSAAPLFVPSPCTQFTNLRSGLRKKLHERIQTFTTDCQLAQFSTAITLRLLRRVRLGFARQMLWQRTPRRFP